MVSELLARICMMLIIKVLVFNLSMGVFKVLVLSRVEFPLFLGLVAPSFKTTLLFLFCVPFESDFRRKSCALFLKRS